MEVCVLSMPARFTALEKLCHILQTGWFLLVLAALGSVAGNGEIGAASNACYSYVPTDLPISISYSRSANTTATTFNFLVSANGTLAVSRLTDGSHWQLQKLLHAQTKCSRFCF